jgi:hypothetical protein
MKAHQPTDPKGNVMLELYQVVELEIIEITFPEGV